MKFLEYIEYTNQGNTKATNIVVIICAATLTTLLGLNLTLLADMYFVYVPCGVALVILVLILWDYKNLYSKYSNIKEPTWKLLDWINSYDQFTIQGDYIKWSKAGFWMEVNPFNNRVKGSHIVAINKDELDLVEIPFLEYYRKIRTLERHAELQQEKNLRNELTKLVEEGE